MPTHDAGSLLLGCSSTLIALLSPSLHLSLLLMTGAVLFLGRAHVRLTREIVMKVRDSFIVF